ncbi:MAG: hypothetical protein Q8Q92_00010, partial [bacterium]|nr:hypothetical protein [bacterium]
MATKADPTTKQSVYIADKDIVKTYPRELSNSEIDFDLHTTVRGKLPEDYHINFLPLTEVQEAWKAVEINAPEILKQAAEPAPVQVVKGIGKALKAEEKYVSPAFKLIVSDPAYAFGITKETTPEVVANTYKPWLEIW